MHDVCAIARAEIGNTDPDRYLSAAPDYDGLTAVQWCGIFVLWCYHQANLIPAVKWEPGRGFVLQHLTRVDSPSPGCVGIIKDVDGNGTDEWHHCIVDSVDGDRVMTIDGNVQGGKVALCPRRLADFWGFYQLQLKQPKPRMHYGIDVSHHQNVKAIDWDEIRRQGYTWMIAKVADGKDVQNAGIQHIQRARAAGLDVGAYQFYIPWRTTRQHVDAMRKACDQARLDVGDIAPSLDVESWKTNDADPRWVPGVLQILARYAEIWGDAIVYHNLADFLSMGQPEAFGEYGNWLADYRNYSEAVGPDWGPEWEIHQTTGKGRIKGYSGPLDLNVARFLPQIGTTLLRGANARKIETLPLDVDWSEFRKQRDLQIRADTAAGKHG